jgi:hypothetical protein
MKKILLRLMEYGLKGVDTYTHNGSVWLIFTDTNQWVLELTSEKTLWYNYNFFKQLFCVATSDVTTQDKFITEWAEKNMIKKPLYSTPGGYTNTQTINDIIETGVKETKISPTHTEYGDWLDGDERLDDIIQNGVKKTHFDSREIKTWVNDVIKGGIRETNYDTSQYIEDVVEVIHHGIKEIYDVDWVVPESVIDEVIDGGVIETIGWNESINGNLNLCVANVVENGVKKTSHRRYLKTYNIEDTIQDGTENDYWVMDGHDTPVDDVIKVGIKQTLPEVGRYINDVEGVIDNGEKINGTYAGGQRQSEKCKSVVEYGIKNPTD